MAYSQAQAIVDILNFYKKYEDWPTDSDFRKEYHRCTGRWRDSIGATFSSLVRQAQLVGMVDDVGKPEPETESEYAISDEHARMVGLVKPIPLKYKKFLAECVAATEHSLDRLPMAVSSDKHTGKESAVLLISDIHAGKMSWDDHGNMLYNRDICAYRMSLLQERTIKLLTCHLRPDTIDEIVICLLGDLVDGSGIYPSQETHQDMHSFTDQAALVAAGLWDLILSLRKIGVSVKVRAVPGNHGRQGKFSPAENNFDYLVYQILYSLSHQSADKGVDVFYTANAAYLNETIKGFKLHLRHIAPSQTETAASRAKYGGWQAIHDYDIVCYGHLHHPGQGTYMDKECIMNGSPVGQDDLSERMAVKSRPSQTLFGIDPDLGLSFLYKVYLDKSGKGGEADSMIGQYPSLQPKKH